MKILKQTIVASGFVFGLLVVAGCGSSEIGPADPNSVPKVDPAVIQKEMNRDEATKHLPNGVKMPAGAMPQGEAGK